MLENLRKQLSNLLESTGRLFSKTKLPPTAFTVIGFMVSTLASYFFFLGKVEYERVAGVLILISGFFDIVDGSVARMTGKVTQRGAFLDSNLDRLSEILLYMGIVLGSLANGAISMFALSMSLMVSYARARAEPFGVKLSGVGIGERSERLIVLSLSSILGLVSYGVLFVAVLATITFLQRLVFTSKRL